MRRLLFVVPVIALALVATMRYAVRPVAADLAIRTAEAQLRLAGEASSAFERVRLARDAAAHAAEAMTADPLRIDGFVMAALASLTLNDSAGAIAAYCAALSIDRRPEIYAGLGQAQLGTGSTNAAIDHYAVAIAARPGLRLAIPDPVLRTMAYARAQQIAVPRGELVRNPRFDESSAFAREGLEAASGTATGSSWTLRAGTNGATAARLVRRGAIEVKTTRRGAIGQTLSYGVGPASVRGRVTIRPVRGRVGLIAGRSWYEPPTVVVEPSRAPVREMFSSEACPVRVVAVVCLDEACTFELSELSAAADFSQRCDFVTRRPEPFEPKPTRLEDAIGCAGS